MSGQPDLLSYKSLVLGMVELVFLCILPERDADCHGQKPNSIFKLGIASRQE